MSAEVSMSMKSYSLLQSPSSAQCISLNPKHEQPGIEGLSKGYNMVTIRALCCLPCNISLHLNLLTRFRVLGF